MSFSLSLFHFLIVDSKPPGSGPLKDPNNFTATWLPWFLMKKKSAVNLTGDSPSTGLFSFSLLSSSPLCPSTTMLWHVLCGWVYLAWSSLSFLIRRFTSFIKSEMFSALISSNNLLFWDSHYAYVVTIDGVAKVPWVCSIFFLLSPFCSSDRITSIAVTHYWPGDFCWNEHLWPAICHVSAYWNVSGQ